MMKKTIRLWLTKHPVFIVWWAGTAAFLAYLSMYMYRKPFTAATFEGETVGEMDYKILLVIAQVIGYAISKFVGIRLISELKESQRLKYFILLILIAFLALVGFMLTESPYNIFWLFVNGLPLGLIWGIVFQYLEGRKITEILTVILSANFIISSGIAKTIGQWMIQNGITDTTMPALVGLLFLPVSLIGIYMLSMIPPPSDEDIKLRTKRLPMDSFQRKQFLKKYGVVVTFFVITYIILTVIRDVRDNFGVEIWQNLGYGENAGMYTMAELPVTLIVLFTLGLLFLFKNNKTAYMVNLLLNVAGILILLVMTLLFSAGRIDGATWMIVSGMGLFIPYILFNGILFDRFIGAFRITANVGFLMYIADAFGYLASVGIMLYKNFGNKNISWLDFYMVLCLIAGSICLVFMLLTLVYTKQISKPAESPSEIVLPQIT
jgi:hypothetical protein